MNKARRFVSLLVILSFLLAPAFLPVEVYGIDSADASSSAKTTTEETAASRVESKAARIQEIRIQARDKYSTAKATFDARVAKLRDQAKTAILTRLVGKYNTLLEKWVKSWSVALERLAKILDKLDSRATEVKATGVDISKYQTAASDASDKIDSAQASLQELADNIYVPEITTDAELGTQVSDITSQFTKDVQATFDAVSEARAAVRSTFDVLKGLAVTK